jgi:hypothetical protein
VPRARRRLAARARHRAVVVATLVIAHVVARHARLRLEAHLRRGLRLVQGIGDPTPGCIG